MGKIFITGPGRSGTTFLMQLLTRLGCDTGYEPYKESFHDNLRAGCEIKPAWKDIEDAKKVFKDLPRYIKGPVWAYYLKYLLINEITEIDRVVMPMRDLTESALSRLDVGLDFMVDKDIAQLHGEHIVELQENILAMLVGKVFEAHFLYGVPLTIMRYPDLVKDMEYCLEKFMEFEKFEMDRFVYKWQELAWQ